MTPTLVIVRAVEQTIRALGLFDRVEIVQPIDLDEALDSLRDPAPRICFVVPAADDIDHTTLPDLNIPMRAEVKSGVELLISHHDAAYSTAGSTDILPLKDHVLLALMWADLGITGLLALPEHAEPLRIEWADAPAIHAWKLRLQVRSLITPR